MVQPEYVNRLVSTVPSGKENTETFAQSIFERTVKNKIESGKELLFPSKKYKPREDIDFALLSQKAYGKNNTERQVDGFDILPEYTSPDRVVYQHKRTGHVVLSFRGTDVADKSRRWRDVGADAVLAAGYPSLSHRFVNAERVTEHLISRYGKANITATGHSLGGSQAMYVSNRFNLHAEVYNPHIHWQDAIVGANYFNTNVHVNITDPVAALYPYIHAQHKDIHYNTKKAPFFAQHKINNFIRKKAPPAQKAPIKTKSIDIENRAAPPTTRVAVRPVTKTPVANLTSAHHNGGQNLTSRTMDCARMSHYQQVTHGCPRRARAAA